MPKLLAYSLYRLVALPLGAAMLKVAARISADDFLLPELCPEAAMAWRNFMAGPKKEADRSRMNFRVS